MREAASTDLGGGHAMKRTSLPLLRQTYLGSQRRGCVAAGGSSTTAGNAAVVSAANGAGAAAVKTHHQITPQRGERLLCARFPSVPSGSGRICLASTIRQGDNALSISK